MALTFSRQKVLDVVKASNNNSQWKYARSDDGNWLYIAADSDGLIAVDITDPADPKDSVRFGSHQPTITGIHDGATSTSVLSDSTLTAANYEWDHGPSYQWRFGTVTNVTKGESASIGANFNTATTVTAELSGGAEWEAGDTYRLESDRAFYLPQTHVLVIGDILVTCGRGVYAEETPPPYTGLVCIYDISTPSTPEWISSYRPPAMNPIPNIGTFFGNEWYQGMDYRPDDPTKIYLASQLNGLVVLDISTPTAITEHAVYGLTELASDVSGGQFNPQDASGLIWETSQIVVKQLLNGDWWAFLANHGGGTMALNINASDLSATDAQWYEAPVVDRIGQGGTIPLRTRNVISATVGAKDYIFESNNTGGPTNDPERGLVVRDVTDPTSATPASYFYEPIGTAFNDTWIDDGDKPVLGLTRFGNITFLDNGQRGLVAFDTEDPELPTLDNLYATNTVSVTNLYTSSFFTGNDGFNYAYYGSSKGSTNSNLYADRVTGVPGMADLYIGDDVSDFTVNSTTSISRSTAQSFNKTSTLAVGSGMGLSEYVFTTTGDSGVDGLLYKIMLYDATGAGLPVNQIPGTLGTGTYANNGNPQTITIVIEPPIPVGAGDYQAVMTLGDAGGSIILAAESTGEISVDTISGGAFPDPFEESSTLARTIALKAGFNEVGDQPAPTLTTPYSTIVLGRGTSGSINLAPNWTGASTFLIQELPPWMVQDGTTGTVNYTNAKWGGQNSTNTIGKGVWDIQVQAIDSTGLLTTETSIWLYIRP